jgi:hypothetical protein
VTVVGAGQQRRELRALQVLLEPNETGDELGRELAIGLLLEELVGGLEVGQRAVEPVVAIEAVLQASETLRQLLAAGGIVPQRRVRGLPLQLREVGASGVDVKGTPSRRTRARAGLGAVRCARSCADRSAPVRRSTPSRAGRAERHRGSVRAGTEPARPSP